ncbi:MAG: DnaJ domain-containing protein [Clostridia bacterium]|nr:DnaJ domain-containing protein [Clostridia bacterium]
MKNYYEILEVNETASQEVIERVYKLLAKKYHPDMNLDNPKEAEEKFKEVTTAYETLSNPDKRKKYDEELSYERQQQNEVNSYTNTTTQETYAYAEPQQEYTQTTYSYEKVEDEKSSQKAQKKILEQAAKEQARKEYEAQKAYNDAYYKALEDMGYTIVYKKTFKDYLRITLTLIILAAVLFGLWHIPFIQEKVIDFYENSGPLKSVIDFIINLFS